MATFCTALVWGLGVSLGAAIGLLAFMVAKEGMDWVLGRRAIRIASELYGDETLAALKRRNELTIQTVEQMVRGADATEEIARQSDELRRFLLKHAPADSS